MVSKFKRLCTYKKNKEKVDNIHLNYKLKFLKFANISSSILHIDSHSHPWIVHFMTLAMTTIIGVPSIIFPLSRICLGFNQFVTVIKFHLETNMVEFGV
jgi:hypothetical protein